MTRPGPHWLGRLAVDEAHFRQIREHGGSHGLRDEAALEAALGRSRQRLHDQPEATLAELAAACAFGLSRNHPYVDGNKRIALVVTGAFLERNGIEMTATDADAVAVMLALVSGELTEPELAAWIDAHSRAL